MRIFQGERIASVLERLGVDEETAIQNRAVSKTLEAAQKRVEGYNFDTRKNVVQYDNVINRHRKVVYTVRRKILEGDNIKPEVQRLLRAMVNSLTEVPAKNNPDFVECEELLYKVNTIVLLDHHRQGKDVINNTVLSYIEEYASSSCELVAEILQYIDLDVKMTSTEAAAMYSGIMIDTNNFLTKTGVRTFEAAAFLRRNGADVTKIRKEFRTEMDEFKIKSKIASSAEIYRDYFAFARNTEGDLKDKNRVILGAKVANELMGILNVKASFVFTPCEGEIYISARSIDEFNVQTLMESIGGGGHLSVAGAQPKNVTIEEAEQIVKDALDLVIDVDDKKG